MFIVFEGVDGSGKSTQARILGNRLRDEGVDVINTREPGGTASAEEIRSLILSGQGEKFFHETEILLFNAARVEHVKELISPSLDSGKIVISDRFALSTFAYQGLLSIDMRDLAIKVHELMIGVNPDLTIILEAPEAGSNLAKRIAEGGEVNRLDERSMNFQDQLWSMMIDSAPYFETTGKVLRVPHGTIEEVSERVFDLFEAFRAERQAGPSGP